MRALVAFTDGKSEHAGEEAHRVDGKDTRAAVRLGAHFPGRALEANGDPEPIPCPEAAESNDDGRVDISDPIMAPGFLFLGLAELRDPGPGRAAWSQRATTWSRASALAADIGSQGWLKAEGHPANPYGLPRAHLQGGGRDSGPEPWKKAFQPWQEAGLSGRVNDATQRLLPRAIDGAVSVDPSRTTVKTNPDSTDLVRFSL